MEPAFLIPMSVLSLLLQAFFLGNNITLSKQSLKLLWFPNWVLF